MTTWACTDTPRFRGGAAALPLLGMRLQSVAYALLVVLVSLALVFLPTPEAGDADHAHPNRTMAMMDVAPEAVVEAVLGDQGRDSADAHPAHHCCHNHVMPAQAPQRINQFAVRHLAFVVSDSDVATLHPVALLRPPRI